MTAQHAFRSGFVAIVGRPNTGKSTLLNTLLGEKISITSDKPQTTRNRIRGVLSESGCQVVFIDTPGIPKPVHRMNELMVESALRTFGEVDAILLLVEATERPGAGDRFIIDALAKVKTPVLLVINKIDLVEKGLLLPLMQEYSSAYPFAEIVPVSALKRDLGGLLAAIKAKLPEGPKYFPDDQLSDQPERFIVAEIVREKVFELTKDEIPYSTAVLIEEMKEEPDLTRIHAAILVERDSQKGIVIGKNGALLKEIGTRARLDAEKLLGVKVFLKLWVKVKKGWREDDRMLRNIGIIEE